jgi:hypothetical protein
MEEKVGIKETKEAIVGILELSLILAEVLKDGAQLSDITKFFTILREHPEFKAKLEAAVQGASLIPAECKDIHLKEGIELTGEVLSFIPRLVETLLKKG